MARTPLVHRARRLARAHRLARARGVDGLALLDRWRTEAWTRREWLRAVGAAATVPLVGCSPGTATLDSGKRASGSARVVIVGAGMAGLDCLHRLAQAGVDAEVYEARDRVGGRVWTGRGLFDGGASVWTELGGEWVDSANTELLTLCDELGLSLLDTWSDDELADVVYLDGERLTEGEVFAAMGPLLDRIDEDLAALDDGGELISYQHPDGAETLDATSVSDYLAAAPVDDRTRSFAELYCTTEYGLECSEQSALNLCFLFGGSMGEGYDERWKIDGGNDQIPEALAGFYPDRIHLGRELEAVTEADDGSFTLSFADGTEVVADIVVLTLPFTILRELTLDVDLPDVKRTCIDTLGYGTNAKLALPFHGRVWRDAGDVGDLITDLGLQVGWESSQLQSGDLSVYANFVGGQHGVDLGEGTDAEQGATLLAQLDQVWPGAAAACAGDAKRIWWPGDPYVKASYAGYTVGQWTSIGGAEGEAVRRLFFAGEHTSYAFQGYMNGAAQTGRDVAEDIVALLDGTSRRARPVLAGRRFR